MNQRRDQQFLAAAIVGLFAAVLLVVLVGAGVLILVIKLSAGGGRSRGSIVDDLNRKEPGWQLKDLAAKRPAIAADQNGATIALNIAGQLPSGWSRLIDRSIDRRNPAEPLPDGEIQLIRGVIEKNRNALVEARRIAFYRQGVFPLQINFKDPLATNLDYVTKSRRTAELLLLDATLQAFERDGEGAIQSAYAIANISGYFEHDPIAIRQLMRIALMAKAIQALEQAMTCANVPDSWIEVWQKRPESEGAKSPLQVAMRGDRALIHATILGVAKGEAHWQGNYSGASVSDADHAWYLKHINELIDLADPSAADPWKRWQRLSTEIAAGPAGARKIFISEQLPPTFFCSTATVRAAAIALAGERYRRAEGQWPTDQKQLEPRYIRKLPADPFTGHPFHFSIEPEGLLVSSEGANGGHPGGFASIGTEQGAHQGFRLLHAERRR